MTLPARSLSVHSTCLHKPLQGVRILETGQTEGDSVGLARFLIHILQTCTSLYQSARLEEEEISGSSKVLDAAEESPGSLQAKTQPCCLLATFFCLLGF